MEIFLLVLLTFVGSFVGTITGFGSSTIMVPIVALFFPLPATLLFVGIVHTFNDIWKIVLFKHGVNWKLLFSFGIPGVLASFVGARIALSSPEGTLTQFLGGFLVSYVLLLVVDPKFKLPHNTFFSSAGGTLSGFLAGILGIGGPVRSVFLDAFGFPKAVYLFTSGATALFVDVSRLGTYYLGGTRLENYLSWGLLIFIPVSFIGAEVAKKFVDKIPQSKFRLVVSFFLFLVGVKLLIFP